MKTDTPIALDERVLREEADAVVPLRHVLHRHPELGFDEHFTTKTIQARLTEIGVPFTAGLAGGTGIVGLIEGGTPGRCVALRADMDALPISERTGLPYASEIPGRMHACGHDGHMAILLASAAALNAVRGQFAGTIKIIFQPSEEANNGGAKMVEDGALENPRVEAIFGLHGWPGMKVGTAATRPGTLLAAVDQFELTVTGRGSHGAYPADGVDPIVAAAAIIQALQTVVSREIDPTEACVVTVASIHAGSAFNIIPGSAAMVGTIRTLTPASRSAACDAVRRIAVGIAAAHRCRCECNFAFGTPATINTPELALRVRDTARRALGEQNFFMAPKPFMWGEDFANYLQHIPGCFFALGVRPPERDDYPMLHNDHFDFNDDAIFPGVAMMTGLALDFLSATPS